MGPNILVLGGGLTGLATAFYARRHGFRAEILGAGSTADGQAQTLEHRGFRFDTVTQRIAAGDQAAKELSGLLGPDLRPLRSTTSQIFHDGGCVDLPWSLRNLVGGLGLGTAARLACESVRRGFRPEPPAPTLEARIVKRYGRTLADKLFLGHAQKFWGVPASRVSSAATGWPLDPEFTRSADAALLYPRLGIGQIADALMRASGAATVRGGSRVTRISWRGNRVVSMHIEGRRRPVDSLVSTLPAPDLLSLMDPGPPPEVRAAAARLRFRSARLVTLLLVGGTITRSGTVYFPDAEFPFTSITEPRHHSAAMTPPGYTSLVLEVPCWSAERFRAADDALLVQQCTARLEDIGWIARSAIVDAIVTRLHRATPVAEAGQENGIAAIDQWLGGFSNVRIARRHGRSTPNDIGEHLREARDIVAGLSASSDTTLATAELATAS